MTIELCIVFRLMQYQDVLIGGFASCSCKKFESEGIPCRHLLSYFNLMQVAFLLSHYIKMD
ncbi:hypothetical protein ACOSP7_019207 [Xanthoceras sorbifolium]